MESCSFIQMTCRTVALPFSVFLMQQFAGLWAVQIEKTSISCRSASASVHTCVCLCARPQLCPIASVLKVYLAAATSARSVTNFTCRCRIIYGANILPCSLAESYYEFDLLNCLLSIACRSGTCLSLSRAPVPTFIFLQIPVPVQVVFGRFVLVAIDCQAFYKQGLVES